ncbi:MAG TPA: TIGR01777 family oxidoreductase [Jiangellaceae bacterium]
MGIVSSQVVEAPLDEVFAWFERPGAIHRLTPPWQPVRVSSEAASLRDGRAVLTVVPGLGWVAEHQPDGYRPRRRFVDELASFPLRTVMPWRHVHEFEAVTADTTRVIDRIETAVPPSILRPLMRYRHQQLADDLAAHARSRRIRPDPLTVAMTGATGLVGRALTAFLSTGGHRVVRLVRQPPRAPDERLWDPDRPDPDLLTSVDAVVHLAGASIAGRFTARHRRAVRDGRIGPTRRLAELAARTDGVRSFVSASAIGIYGPDRGDEILTESSERGEGFLADVVADWEAAAVPALDAGLRMVNVRTGIVQTPRGGALRLFYPMFLLGLGGRIGDGRQWTSWIGIDDLLDVYLRALVDDTLDGPINAVAPEPVRNADYARVLARVLHRPALVPVPRFGPRIVLGGQGAGELAEASQRVRPARLSGVGHQFRHPGLDRALGHVLGRFDDGDAGAEPTIGDRRADTSS